MLQHTIRTRKQQTIAQAISYTGIGIHTGQQVHMRLCPAEVDSGIYFKRVDLTDAPKIDARLDSVFDTSRSTNLQVGNIRIYTVEHVLAALKAFEIDNVCIELDSHEPPIANGSSDVFVEMIEQAGVSLQDADVQIGTLQEPIFFSEGDVHIVALPDTEYRLSYTLFYPNSKALGCQYHSIALTKDSFKSELAPCRTFALYEELSYLMDRGLIKGGSLDNAVVIKENAVLSKGGLFFENEMVRHKILDLVGDLSLIGMAFTAHIIAIRSGHSTNFRFAQKLYEALSQQKTYSICHYNLSKESS